MEGPILYSMKDVLLAYWTQTGSTKEAISIIAEVLEARGLSIATEEVAAAKPEDYSAVVVGSPIHGMRWAPEATGFIDKNREVLSRKKVALFSVAYVYFTGRSSWKKAVDGALGPLYDSVTPLLTGVFPGRVEKRLPGIARLIFGIPKSAYADIFDPEAIRVWANDLADRLGAERVAPR